MKKIEKYMPWIGTALLGIGAWIFWTFIHPELLSFQEELQMFLFDKEYFLERVALPSGVARYVAEFLTQFYSYVNIGALVVALLFVALQQCVWHLAKKHCKDKAWYWVSFLPVLMLWFYMGDPNVKLTFVVSILFALVAMLCYPADAGKKTAGIYLFIATPLVYWCAGPCVLIFALYALLYNVYATHVLFSQLPPYGEGQGGRSQKSALMGVGNLLYAIALILASASFVPQPVYRLFYGISYSLQIVEFHALQFVVMALFACVPFIISCLPHVKSERTANGFYGGLFGCVFSLGMLIVPLGFDAKECEVLKYDMLARGNKWDKIIEMAQAKNPDFPTSVATLNLALGMKGRLNESGMSFFQNGWGGAFPHFNRNCIVSICLSEISYQLGLVNSAQRFAFEANEAISDNNKSARLVRRLVETNIANGQYEVARKYIHMLQKTLFYKRWADETLALLDNEDAINNHPYYGYMRKIHLDEDFLFSDAEIDRIMGQLVMKSKENNLAIQYLLFLPQLEGNQQKYMMYLDYVKKRLNRTDETPADSVAADSI